jgi:hypothetical protein
MVSPFLRNGDAAPVQGCALHCVYVTEANGVLWFSIVPTPSNFSDC